ncbi:patatin-like protein [Sphingobium sufflavum]|uniref:patatin-like protein n=1 Tax=Sphingobium sufflavum TaxID=1129547 RepID=UPI001F2BABF1|nr:patatin-like protein [Sphingobium sufflavum]MCE7797643.1 patatin-like protein [Sphingobium sufflavum]
MREKELRLALVCYGGVSLAVYMHGITKEVWHLARASRAFHAGEAVAGGSAAIYRQLLDDALCETGTRLRVMPDILAGASAGGINAIFLAHALETGQSLEPLTALWLERADADVLLDPDARPISRFTKFWVAPLLWLLARRRGDTVERTVAPETREEVRRKLSNFVRARWFAPPFGGKGFCRVLLDAFDAMAAAPAGPPLLPDSHPLDLFVTATDFMGHEETLRLNSPRAIAETEHRLAISFAVRGDRPRRLADATELAFAARATASFPGAFPPFTPRELDEVLAERGQTWPGRSAFLARILPRQWMRGTADDAPIIDGSVLANAPFAQAIPALRNRPARREVDRRFVYIEPTPHMSLLGGARPRQRDEGSATGTPGFFRTIFGAMSNIPREQPIRDDLDQIALRSERIRRMQRVVDAMRPTIDTTIEQTIGQPLFADRPTPARLASWRGKAHRKAARASGFAYVSYAQLKLSGIVYDLAGLLGELAGDTPAGHETPPGALDGDAVRAALWQHIRISGADIMPANGSAGRNDAALLFLRAHDTAFRIRRLRFLTRRLAETEEGEAIPPGEETEAEGARMAMRAMIYEAIDLYAAREAPDIFDAGARAAAARVLNAPGVALSTLAEARGLAALDAQVEVRLSDTLSALMVSDRRRLLKAYLGFPFYDIATLPMLQGEGLDEYDPIKVDRISPDDAVAIRTGGALATLKGIEFNSFGAFFSRSYRENDYLWGRLHGADRLVDIILSAVPPGSAIDVAGVKRALFNAILDEEEERLPGQTALIASLRTELAGGKP